MSKELLKVPAITGPTACGKTELVLKLAQEIPVEVVSCDSRKVYKGLDIGTDKPTADERRLVRFHLIDVVEPQEEFSVETFTKLALKAIAEIFRRKRLPVLEGGTGLYLASLAYGYEFEGSPPIDILRQYLSQKFAKQGYSSLLLALLKAFPDAKEEIDISNPARMIRFVEKALYTLKQEEIERKLKLFGAEKIADEVLNTIKKAKRRKKRKPGIDFEVVGFILEVERLKLWNRIRQRTQKIFADGLVEEVKGLLNRGVPKKSQSMQGIGYKEIIEYLNGNISLEQAEEMVVIHTRQFAKRQQTWNRHQFQDFTRIPFTSETDRVKAYRYLSSELKRIHMNNLRLLEAGNHER